MAHSKDSSAPLTPQEAHRLIEGVQSSDREDARRAIHDAVGKAQARWINTQAIAEALAIELLAVTQNRSESSTTAAFLRDLARAIETRAERH